MAEHPGPDTQTRACMDSRSILTSALSAPSFSTEEVIPKIKDRLGTLGQESAKLMECWGCHEPGRLGMAETSGSCETMSKRIWTSFRSWKQVMVPRSEKGINSQGLWEPLPVTEAMQGA